MVVSIKRKIKDSFLSAGNSGKNMPDKGAQIRPCNGMGGMAALYRKEMSDHIEIAGPLHLLHIAKAP